MWVALARDGGMGMLAGVFIGWVLAQVLAPIIDAAEAGSHASDEVAQQSIGYMGALTEQNIILVMGLAVGIAMLARSARERRVY